MEEATTHLLSYASKRLRAVNSRSYRVVSPSTSAGSSVNLGQSIEFRIAGSQQSSFLDNSTMYIKFVIKNNDATDAANFNFEGKNGAFSLIKKVDILVGGSTISTVDNYNLLHSMFSDTDTSAAYGRQVGNVLFGAGSSSDGATVLAAAAAAGGNAAVPAGTRTIILPFLLNNIANSKKYIPLFSRDEIRIKIQLESAQLALKSVDAGLVDADVEIQTPELIYNVVELSAEAMALVDQSVDSKYEIVADDYRHTSSTVTATANQTHVANLGFSFSSLNRVLISLRNSTNLANVQKFSIGNRCRSGLEEVNLLLNGESIPSQRIKISSDSASEALAELLIADRALMATDHDSRINGGAGFLANDPDGSNAANTGNFQIQIDTESMRSNSDDPGIYSGVSTISSSLQAQLKFGANRGAGANADASGPTQIDFFAQYTSLLTLDMKGSQTFVLSV